MKIRIILCGLLTIFVVCLLIVAYNKTKNSNNEDKDISLKVALFRTGTVQKTYYFLLRNDGILEAFCGERKHNNISSSNFLSIVSESNSRQLTSVELDNILEVADEVEKNAADLKKLIIKDGWDVIVYYHGISYELNYTGAPSDVVPKLIDALIEYSPVQVDFDSWS